MRFKISRRKVLVFITIFAILGVTGLIAQTNNGLNKINSSEGLQTSAQIEVKEREWLGNPTFDQSADPYHWYPQTEGDSTDISTSTGPTQANLRVIGDSREKEVLLNTATQSNWQAFNKSDLVIVPQRASVPYYGIDDNGAWCSHWWWEGETGGQPKNTPRMHWKTNVSLPVDMSDYIITSASFNAIINASVDPDIDTPGDTLARPGVNINQFQTYDYAQFYVEISTLDIDELNTYRIAFNQTRLLGNEGLSFYDMEGLMGVFEEQAIIDALNNVLVVDPGHNNFTIVLGIYMYCEDNNSGTDRDHWDDMRFKTLNLTFSYVKKINQFTTVAWKQDCNAINTTKPNSTIIITGANFNFKYKIDQNWTEASQNSRIRILVDDRTYEEKIDLIDYIYSPDFQDARPGGFTNKSQIVPFVNFSISIQVFLAEDFGLENDITISITNASLLLSWIEIYQDPPIEPEPEPWYFLLLFILAIIGVGLLAGYLVAYQLYLKYPVPVRKVRKYRKTLAKDKTPDVKITSQEGAFDSGYQKEVGKSSKLLKGSTPTEPKVPPERLKGPKP